MYLGQQISEPRRVLAIKTIGGVIHGIFPVDGFLTDGILLNADGLANFPVSSLSCVVQCTCM